MTSFDPKPYLKNLSRDARNPRMYLQTAHRVLWFRTENPNGSIVTDMVQLDPFPVFKATVINADGTVLANSYGSAQPKAGAVYSGREIEKAETAAVGRALGLAGYGSQFSGDDEDEGDHLADAPTTPVQTNPFGNEAVREGITAALENHGMNTDEGKAFIFANMQQGTVYERFSHMHPTFTPDDVLNAMPALAAKFHLMSALQAEKDAAEESGTPEDTNGGEDAPQQAGRPFAATSPSRAGATPAASATPSKTSTSPSLASPAHSAASGAPSGGSFGASTTVSPSGSARSQSTSAPSQTPATWSSGEAPSAAASAKSRRSPS